MRSRPLERVIKEWTEFAESPNCKRDTTIICKDGVVSWNRLLLASWSHLVKGFLIGSGYMCAGCDNPLVLLMPDYDVAMVRQMLQWSCSGEVLVDADMVPCFMSLLNALAVSVDVIQRRVVNAREEFKCQHCSKAFDDKDVMESHTEFCQQHRSFDNVQVKQEFSQVGDACSEDAFKEPEVITLDDSEEEADETEHGGKQASDAEGPVPGATDEAQDQVDVKGNDEVAKSKDETTEAHDKDGRNNQDDTSDGYEARYADDVSDLFKKADDLEEKAAIAKQKTPYLKLRKILAKRSTKKRPRDEDEDEAMVVDVCPENVVSLKKDSDSEEAGPSVTKKPAPPAKRQKKVGNFNLPEVNCAGCSVGFPRLSALKRHIALNHFYDRVLLEYTKDSVCLLCSKTIPDSSRMVLHVGAAHNTILKLVSPGVRTQLEEMEEKYGVRPSEGGPFKLDKTSCKTCAKGFVRPSELRGHLASVHFRQELIEKYSDGSVCGLCDLTILKKRGTKYALSYHIGMVHDKLPEVLPPVVKQQLDVMFQAVTGSASASSGPGRRCRVSVKTRKFKGGPCKLEDSSCGACSAGFPTEGILRRHLSRTHFAGDLLTKYSNDGNTCGLCEKAFPSDGNQKCRLGTHLGTSHDKLDEVMPPELREKLAKMSSKSRLKKANGTRKYRLPNSTCRKCRLGFDMLCRLKGHLAVTHFADGIVEANGGDELRCSECGKDFSSSRPREENRARLCRHVGLIHGRVDGMLGHETSLRLATLQAQTRQNRMAKKTKRVGRSVKRARVQMPI